MLGDIFSSANDYIKSKLVNPFLGTLIFVWLIRNWYLVYSLFTFDDKFTWKDKTQFIKTYIDAQDLWHEIFTNLWISGIIFLTSYLIMFITRTISNFYEFKILPLAYQLTESKKLITQERYQQAMDEIKEKNTALENLRDSLSKAESALHRKTDEINNLENRFISTQNELQKNLAESEKLENDLRISVELLETQLNSKDKELMNQQEEINNYEEKLNESSRQLKQYEQQVKIESRIADGIFIDPNDENAVFWGHDLSIVTLKRYLGVYAHQKDLSDNELSLILNAITKLHEVENGIPSYMHVYESIGAKTTGVIVPLSHGLIGILKKLGLVTGEGSMMSGITHSAHYQNTEIGDMVYNFLEKLKKDIQN